VFELLATATYNDSSGDQHTPVHEASIDDTRDTQVSPPIKDGVVPVILTVVDPIELIPEISLFEFKTNALDAVAVPEVTDRYPLESPPPPEVLNNVPLIYTDPATRRSVPTYKLLATAAPPLIVSAPPSTELVASVLEVKVAAPNDKLVMPDTDPVESSTNALSGSASPAVIPST
jgi:hypothetical protein